MAASESSTPETPVEDVKVRDIATKQPPTLDPNHQNTSEGATWASHGESGLSYLGSGTLLDEDDASQLEYVTATNVPTMLEKQNSPENSIIIVPGLLDTQKPSWPSAKSEYSEWLAEREGQEASNILFFNYDTSTILSGRHTRSAIRSVALELLHKLQAERLKNRTSLPIMFVAHDIGGTIVKDVLTVAALDPKSFGDVFDFTRVLLFYHCPHRSNNHPDMEERLCQFLYSGNDRHELPMLARSTFHLAKAVVEVNNTFLESKHIFLSYVLSVYHSKSSSHDPFDDFAGTLGVPFEFRIERLPSQDLDVAKIKGALLGIELELRVDESKIKNMRALISAASPLLPLKTALDTTNSFSWITETQTYQSWRQQKNPSMLYVHGDTDIRVVSEHMFYSLDNIRHGNNGHNVLYFSFDRFDARRDTVQNLLATFLAQITGHFQRFADHLDTEWLERREIERNWNYKEVLLAFDNHLRDENIQDITFVVNYFDECDPVSRKMFLDFFFEICRYQNYQWKCLVTSRIPGALSNEISSIGGGIIDLEHIETPIDEMQQVSADLDNELRRSLLANNPELHSYKSHIDHEFCSISNLKPGTRHLIIRHMSAAEDWSTRKTIHDTFGNVESLTLKLVLETILGNTSDHNLVGEVLWWILCSAWPPTIGELEDALGFFAQPNAQDFTAQSKLLLVNEALKSLAGVVSCENNEIHIEQLEIRDLLTTEVNEGAAFGFSCDNGKKAHEFISRTLLRYLRSDAAGERLTALNQTSKHRGTRVAVSCDRTNLCSYSLKFLLYHLGKAIKEPGCEIRQDLDLFVKSANMQPWLISFWAMEHPVTRSQEPYTTIYPILAGAGLLELADSLVDVEKDTGAGMIEACLHGHFDAALELLSRNPHTTKSLGTLLTVAGSTENESGWLQIIEYIKINHSDFPWQSQEALVRRAAEIGLSSVLRALIIAKCPLEGTLPLIESYRTPLMRAARYNQADAVTILLKHGANPNFRDPTGWTAFHHAALRGSSDVIELLHRGKADLDSKTHENDTPLHLACVWGHFRATKILLSLGANPNTSNSNHQDQLGWTPLAAAISSKHTDCARLLIESHADLGMMSTVGSALAIAVRTYQDRQLDILRLLMEYKANVNEVDPVQDPPLIEASWLPSPENLAVVDLLLRNGADINTQSKERARPIEIAVTRSDVALVRRFLEEKDVELEPVSDSTWTPLILARNNAEITQLLLEAGANPNAAPENEELPIMSVVRDNNVEVARLLIDYGAIIDPPEIFDDKWEPLEWAARCGQADMIRILCDGGADKDRRWSDGRTLVHRAMSEAGLGALLEFRPNINTQDDWGDAPLHEINVSTSLENIRLLVRAGADINVANKKNVTPLAKAIYVGHEAATQFLLSKKPKVNIASPNRGGPLHVACYYGKVEIAKDLIKAGADVDLAVPRMAGTPLMSVFPGYYEQPEQHDDELKTRLIDLLLESGADIAATANMFGSIVGAAAFGGSVAMLNLVLSRGGQAGVVDAMGRLPLHYAALRGDLDRVDLLLDAGEDPTSVDCIGRNALFWAVQGGSLEVIDRILEKVDKKCLDQQDKDGWTPLCWAARGCGARENIRQVDEETQSKVLELLLVDHARLRVMTTLPDRQWTPLDIARYHGRPEKVLNLLTFETSDSADDQSEVLDIQITRRLTSWDAECDYCFHEILGIKYHCNLCVGFLLCYKCYNSRDILHDKDHEFTANGPEYTTKTLSEHSSSPSEIDSESISASSASEPNDDIVSIHDGNDDNENEDDDE